MKQGKQNANALDFYSPSGSRYSTKEAKKDLLTSENSAQDSFVSFNRALESVHKFPKWFYQFSILQNLFSAWFEAREMLVSRNNSFSYLLCDTHFPRIKAQNHVPNFFITAPFVPFYSKRNIQVAITLNRHSSSKLHE